jgi:hypothetical protein
MKIKPACIPCIFGRANYECDLVFTDESKKMEVLYELIKFTAEHLNDNISPAFIGIERDRLIKRRSGNSDPYAELKMKSNKVAMGLLDDAKAFYNMEENKIEALLRIAAAANSMEYGITGYSFDEEGFRDIFDETLREDLVGEIDRIELYLKDHEKILYLTDNAGEIVFDIFVAGELMKMGKEVVISPKSHPVMNDATTMDLEEIEYEDKAVPSGSYVGVSLEEAPRSFLDLFFDPRYLIFAKGMGNYETISNFHDELKGRLIYIFRAKCESVASDIGVNKGVLVAKAI